MNKAEMPFVTLGVSGSIAAYKTPGIVSSLKKHGLDVHVAITKSGLEFVTEQALTVMSGNEVITADTKITKSGKPQHIEIADHTDLMIVAPATARMLGKLAHGDVDNPICEIYTALLPGTPVLVAPAMNGRMLNHPSVRRNITQVKQDGVQLIEPTEGILACGYEGNGKLAETDVIINAVLSALEARGGI